MKELHAYKVDAFTARPYTGNPAGVVPDAAGLSVRAMQAIAREMNVSETAFVLPPAAPGAKLRLRYFTPTSEVKLCGHATVATFHVLRETGKLPERRLKVETQAGVLDVEVEDELVWFASDPVTIEPAPISADETARLLGTPVVADPLLVKRKLFATLPGIKAMEALRPDLPAIARLYREQGVDGIVPVSFETLDPANLTHIRYFVPGIGIDEDPVTGAAHMALAGYLLRLGKIQTPARFTGEQGNFCGRAGTVIVEAEGSASDPRVRIAGRAVTVLRGTMRTPSDGA